MTSKNMSRRGQRQRIQISRGHDIIQKDEDGAVALSDKPFNSLDSKAAEWIVRLDAGALSLEDMTTFTIWFSKPQNRQAFVRLNTVWSLWDRVSCT
ncbi:FecR/PupR family sigma factor regulator [Novosphingobium terrae]|uniref:FecR/PupR family sigma factor regulator n=1 Tax=Novosphingobium terrae TaxID=2726189 RepID=UPI001981E481|nr:FecR/PupR family sigma factor regulator [Novosphingobium terrae]